MSDENQFYTNNTEPTSVNNLNNPKTEYSFWAEQAATINNANTINQESSDSSAYNNSNIPFNTLSEETITSSLNTNNKKQKKRFKKACAFTVKAALFGVIASASFLGFNSAYYHFNPEAKRMDSRPGNSNNKLNLDSNSALSTTTVTQGVNISSADVSNLVDETMSATVAISSVYNSSYYIWGQEYNQESEGGGSGIIIGKSDSELLIATNNHVVEDTTKIIITFIDGSTAEGVIKGRDSQSDLAVVSVDIATLSKDTLSAITVAKLGDSESVKVGQMVVAIGNALGYGQSVTVGYISAKDREINISSNNTTMTVLQTDAAINPGNSGGALLNMKGEVIGINSAKLASTSVEGIGYSIPINNALPIVNDLMNREILADDEKGYIGIYPTDVDAQTAKAYNWPVGVYVYKLAEGGAAEKAGILQGDIITEINDITITTSDQLRELVNSYRYGTKVSVTLQRLKEGQYQEQTIEVTLQQGTTIANNDQEQNDTTENETITPAPNTPNLPSNPGDSSEDGNSSNPLEDFFNRFLP